MESSFYFMILSKIVNVLYIVLSILGFNILIVHMVFIRKPVGDMRDNPGWKKKL